MQGRELRGGRRDLRLQGRLRPGRRRGELPEGGEARGALHVRKAMRAGQRDLRRRGLRGDDRQRRHHLTR